MEQGPASGQTRAARRRRRRTVRLVRTGALCAVGVAVVGYLLWPSGHKATKTAVARPAAKSTVGTGAQTTATSAAATTTTSTVPPFKRVPDLPPTDGLKLSLLHTIGGEISPKSVAASNTGLVFAQNMMYRHTVTVYDSSGNPAKTIPDGVDLSQFGVQGHPGVSKGAPVEAAFTPDAAHVYVSNYSMYGAGFGPEGNDNCTPASARAAGDTDSFVYRIDTKTLAIDQVIQVGLVPKFLAVSPDGKYLLVANWCSYDLSIVDVAQGKEVQRLPMGAYPRGIAISPDSATGYVAIMGSDKVIKVSLSTLTATGSFTVGSNPRHAVMDPAGKYLYVSLNGSGQVVKVDLATDRVIATVHTGSDCRSLAISADGRSLYVVNYLSNTITKLAAANLAILQNAPTGVHPIGITYDATTGDIWVAVYSGQILVFADR